MIIEKSKSRSHTEINNCVTLDECPPNKIIQRLQEQSILTLSLINEKESTIDKVLNNEDSVNKNIEKEYNSLEKKYKQTLKEMSNLSKKVSSLKGSFKNVRKEFAETLIKFTTRNYDKSFKKLFIKCYGIIKRLRDARSNHEHYAKNN